MKMPRAWSPFQTPLSLLVRAGFVFFLQEKLIHFCSTMTFRSQELSDGGLPRFHFFVAGSKSAEDSRLRSSHLAFNRQEEGNRRGLLNCGSSCFSEFMAS